jgi:hypothetical protein
MMRQQEETLLDTLLRFAGGPAQAMLFRHLSLLYLMGIDAHLLAAERAEILGLAHGTPDPFPDLGPRYGRLVAYHAIHELSQRFAVDNPALGCSLVAVGAARGKRGHAFVARNFDFEGGAVFDADKLVVAVRPTGGYGFVSVSWGGMAGVVSGMNEKGLALVINAGVSTDYRRVGAPTTLLVRDALQRAATIDEAVAVLTERPAFVTDIIGMADRTGAVAVLELTPQRHRLRRGDLLLATNHLEHPDLAADASNRARIEQSTTAQRRQRLERIFANHGRRPIGRDTLLGVLRDRRTAEGRTLPLGHRHSLDALIATHSVIFDSTAGYLWVSQGPHTLGPYHGYDAAKLIAAETPEALREGFLPSLPGDPLREVMPLVNVGRGALQRARLALDSDDPDAAARYLRTAGPVVADHPTSLYLHGELARHRGDAIWARRYFEQALRCPPEYERDAERVRRGLATVLQSRSVARQGP